MSDSMNDQGSGTAEVDAEQKNWAMIAHLSGLIGFLGPLIVWVIQKDKMPFVNDQAKEALNFQIAVLIAWVITGVASCFVVGWPSFPWYSLEHCLLHHGRV